MTSSWEHAGWKEELTEQVYVDLTGQAPFKYSRRKKPGLLVVKMRPHPSLVGEALNGMKFVIGRTRAWPV